MAGWIARLSSRPAAHALPARVQAAVREQQASSEILIGWVQLGVVTTFAVLFALAPPPAGATSGFAPEPWVIGAYLGFTLLRLALAYARRLPDWLLYVSVVVDMALLLALIWTIPLKYGQPASFFLKAPTLLYVFIFIALRALRYEVRYVLLAGGVAAAGWLLMVWYVVQVDPADPMITRDYIEYLTSNSVLLGAEFDKVISIVMVTLILAMAIARARRLMIRAVAEEAAARDLSRFVPTGVARRVKTGERSLEIGDGQVREATILFTDVEGFTTLSEGLDPTELIGILNEYFAVVSGPIVANGGVINQFQGDAILATFNLPDELPEHAAAAVRAALEIQAALGERAFGSARTRLRSRVGINSGVVVGGLVGTQDRVGYTVHGDEVNLAARLEQENKRHGTRIIVSGRTRELAGPGRFGFRPLGTAEVRGRRAPVEIHTVEEMSRPNG